MKVVIAIDSFKGSVSSMAASTEIAAGINKVYPEADNVILPLADGGEGTVEALVSATGGQIRSVQVTGPLQQPVQASYGILGNGHTAVIEVAAACGLPLVPVEHRNPLRTTTYGVGELILDAIGQGCREFVIGLGGSATNDAGIGMLQALGYRFTDEAGNDAGHGGEALLRIRSIDAAHACPELGQCVFKIACDVDNPLYGPDGAAYVFGPQKGASPEMVEVLDEGLAGFAGVVQRAFGVNVQNIPGAGAAGGLGAAFAVFLQGKLQSGVGWCWTSSAWRRSWTAPYRDHRGRKAGWTNVHGESPFRCRPACAKARHTGHCAGRRGNERGFRPERLGDYLVFFPLSTVPYRSNKPWNLTKRVII